MHFVLPFKFRWALLLLASCYFYMAFIPIYILILFLTIIIDYIAGIYIEKERNKGPKNKSKTFLIASLIGNIGVLAVFKYYNFFIENVNWISKHLHHENLIPHLDIILPIGLSFHTFQAMSYTIEVYRGNQKAERNFGIYSLYVMFYHQLVAGPIERPQNILHQFYEKHYFNYENVTSGLRLMAWGLFKKVVIADRLALITDPIFNEPHSYNGISLIVASLFFSFQIFCDFSGYSDIALGSARVMGFKLMTNFNRPYHSSSISEFWKRWHISLSSWFKDYLYISLGGNRVSIPRWYFNLLFVFIISGFWHGANWTFIAWGALHGCYLVITLLTQNFRNRFVGLVGLKRFPKLHLLLQIAVTFTLTTIAWVFFRANTISDAIYIITHYTKEFYFDIYKLYKNHSLNLNIYVPNKEIWLGIGFILLMETVHFIQTKISINSWIKKQPRLLRWSIYYGVIATIWIFGVFENRQFIYFQF